MLLILHMLCMLCVLQDPVGGTMEDHFYIAAPGVLHKDTTLWVNGQMVKERSVYRLKK